MIDPQVWEVLKIGASIVGSAAASYLAVARWAYKIGRKVGQLEAVARLQTQLIGAQNRTLNYQTDIAELQLDVARQVAKRTGSDPPPALPAARPPLPSINEVSDPFAGLVEEAEALDSKRK